MTKASRTQARSPQHPIQSLLEAKQLVEENLIGEVSKRSSRWAEEIATQIKPYVKGKAAKFSSGTVAGHEVRDNTFKGLDTQNTYCKD